MENDVAQLQASLPRTVEVIVDVTRQPAPGEVGGEAAAGSDRKPAAPPPEHRCPATTPPAPPYSANGPTACGLGLLSSGPESSAHYRWSHYSKQATTGGLYRRSVWHPTETAVLATPSRPWGGR